MEYKINGEVKKIEGFGKNSQREFDEALAALPELVRNGRAGDEEAGNMANELLWKLANESFNTRKVCNTTYKTIHGFGNKTDDYENESKTFSVDVLEWRDDDEGEYECVIDTIQAITEAHARLILRNGIHYTNKYPKGAWLAYTLNGKRIELDTKGRIV